RRRHYHEPSTGRSPHTPSNPLIFSGSGSISTGSQRVQSSTPDLSYSASSSFSSTFMPPSPATPSPAQWGSIWPETPTKKGDTKLFRVSDDGKQSGSPVHPLRRGGQPAKT